MNKQLLTLRLDILAISGCAGWIQSALLFQRGRGKLGYVFGSSSRWVRLGRLILLVGPMLWCSAQAKTGVANLPETGADFFEVWHDERSWWLQNSVTAIVQTQDGYLWLGTYHGLVRYDGSSFKVFDASNASELPNGRITSLYESAGGVLWIGHETGHLSKLAAGRFQLVKLSSNWPGGVIEAITSDEEGKVWLLNDSGVLFRLPDGLTAKTPGGATQMAKATLARARDGKVWLTSNGQVAMLEKGRVVPVVFPEEQGPAFHFRVFAAADGGVWLLDYGRLRKWNHGSWQAEIEAPVWSNVVVETRFGLLAGTMREGLYLLRFGAKPLHFSRAEGLSQDWVRALCVDQEGNCWIGTGSGVDYLRPRKIQMLAPEDHWQGCRVQSFIVQPDGGAWVGTEGAGLYRYDGQRWTVFNEANGLHSPFIWSVLETREHELFAGTWGGGLFRRNGDHFERSGELSQITAPVTALYEGRGGELWIGTKEGLQRYQGGKLVPLSGIAGKEILALPDVRAITESADGTLWFGMSGGGLGRWKSGELKQFRKGDGLGSDLVACLSADADGTLWIGTSDNGLTRLKQERFSTITAEQGLPSKVISQIVDDAAGYLWLGSQEGILRVSKAELHQCANGHTNLIRCLSYGRSEGLTAQVCPGGFQPGACRGADGRLWFPTVKGLAVINPANVASNAVPPPVVIETILVDGSSTSGRRGEEVTGLRRAFSRLGIGARTGPPLADPGLFTWADAEPLRIAPGHRRFEFHYTGLSFVAPDKVRFRRKLEGLERDWVDAGAKRVAEYNDLRPGKYTFKVVACNNDDVWNEQGASLAFTVLPFFWQTLGFRAVSMAGGAGAVAFGVLWAGRRRLRRALEISERQRAVERERSRIARDMHDELGASLTRISLLSETVRDEMEGQTEVVADLDQIHTTAREVTRAMDEIVWAVNPTHDTLDSLVGYLGRYAERYLSAAAIRCRLELPLHLPPWVVNAEIRHNVFLAFKEALHNIVKHAGATEVRLSVELGPGQFTLLVMDNGCGFHSNPDGPIAAADEVRSASGNGLLNMRKRMEEIGGECACDTAPGKGACVKLVVMIKR